MPSSHHMTAFTVAVAIGTSVKEAYTGVWHLIGNQSSVSHYPCVEDHIFSSPPFCLLFYMLKSTSPLQMGLGPQN